MRDIAAIDVDDLLKIILLLVVIWLVLEIAEGVLSITLGLLGPLRPLLGLVVLILIVLWLVDRI